MDDFSEGIGKNYIRNKKHLPFDLEGVFVVMVVPLG
jgi:hypothetical protein